MAYIVMAYKVVAYLAMAYVAMDAGVPSCFVSQDGDELWPV